MARFLTLFLCLVFLLSGCALWDHFFPTEEEEQLPAQLMNEGMENFEKGYYETASEAFQKLKDRYPYSQFALDAEIKMADALYEQGLYDEAYEAYDEFERLHPKHPKSPYIVYRKGMSHFRQVTTIDRDQSHTLKAKEEFERLVKKYPRSEYAESARAKVRECYIYLAEYELYVGNFYFKMERYQAAMDRYRYLLEHYPDFGQYHQALENYRICQERLPLQPQEEPERERKPSWWKRITRSVGSFSDKVIEGIKGIF
jgi:outer membrane protein assembly factor BamD